MIIDGHEFEMKVCCSVQMSIIKEMGDIEVQDKKKTIFSGKISFDCFDSHYFTNDKYFYRCEICGEVIHATTIQNSISKDEGFDK